MPPTPPAPLDPELRAVDDEWHLAQERVELSGPTTRVLSLGEAPPRPPPPPRPPTIGGVPASSGSRPRPPPPTSGPRTQPDHDESEVLGSIRFLWEPLPEDEAEATPKPAAMFTYDPEGFRWIMGSKVGPIAKLRGSKKDKIVQAIVDFNQASDEAARRESLRTIVDVGTTWISMNQTTWNGNARRKAGRLVYMRGLVASAQWELDPRHTLSAQRDTTGWKVEGSTMSRTGGIGSGLVGLDQSIGIVQDLADYDDDLAKSRDAAGNVQGAVSVISSRGCQEQFEGLKGTLGSLRENISLDLLAGLAEQYLAILDMVDQFGISDLLKAHAAFKDFKKTKKRIAALSPHRASRDPFILEFCGYALGKLGSRQFSNVYLGINYFIKGVSRIVTLLSGGTAALVTEVLNQSSGIAVAVHELGRNAKGVYKWVIGTRSVARKSRAALLIWRASLEAPPFVPPSSESDDKKRAQAAERLQPATDRLRPGLARMNELLTLLSNGRAPSIDPAHPPGEAMALFKGFIEPDFVVGSSFVKPYRQAVWDYLWSLGHEGARLLIATSIGIVKSDTSQGDVLKQVYRGLKEDRSIAGVSAQMRHLAASKVSLGLQTIIFNALSSRPKYAGGSALENAQDTIIEKILGT